MTFRHIAILTSCLFFVLAIVWMFFPEQMLAQWGAQYSDATGIVSRRCAAFYTGVAMMFFIARNAVHSATRMVLIQGIITICAILIFLGVYEFVAGHASYQILAAVVIESVLGLTFIYVWNTSSKVNNLNNLRTKK